MSIAGRWVPRDKAVVLIHLGHSDVAGRASTPAALRPYFYTTDPRLWIYRKGGVWKPAREPSAPDKPGALAGAGMGLLRAALAHADPDTHFIWVGLGHGGHNGGYCLNFRKGGRHHDTLLAPALELRGRVTFGGLFVMLGLTEHRTGMAQLHRFADCLAGIADDFRRALGEPELPLLVGDWTPGATGLYSPTGPHGTVGRQQIRLVPGKTHHAAVVRTDGLSMEPSDNRHLDLLGLKTWGQRAMAILRERRWAPWMTR